MITQHLPDPELLLTSADLDYNISVLACALRDSLPRNPPDVMRCLMSLLADDPQSGLFFASAALGPMHLSGLIYLGWLTVKREAAA